MCPRENLWQAQFARTFLQHFAQRLDQHIRNKLSGRRSSPRTLCDTPPTRLISASAKNFLASAACPDFVRNSARRFDKCIRNKLSGRRSLPKNFLHNSARKFNECVHEETFWPPQFAQKFGLKLRRALQASKHKPLWFKSTLAIAFS